MTKENCPKHKKPKIYSYNNKSYCEICLNELFEAIYRAEGVLNKN